MQRFQELDKERAAIEAEIELIAEELCSGPDPIGLKGPLVDSEGFPRADIDVYTVRHKRHRFACLQTDLKWKMKEIEDVMASIYSENKQTNQVAPRPQPTHVHQPTITKEEASEQHAPIQLEGKSMILTAPFAVVDTIQPDSPSSEAGLLTGDQILTFGSANVDNHRDLVAIREIVMRNINSTIEVVVQRDTSQFRLYLVPHTWSGQGVLGCHIVPLHV